MYPYPETVQRLIEACLGRREHDVLGQRRFGMQYVMGLPHVSAKVRRVDRANARPRRQRKTKGSSEYDEMLWCPPVI